MRPAVPDRGRHVADRAGDPLRPRLVGESAVVEIMHDLKEFAQIPSVLLVRGDQRGDDRPRARPGDPLEPVARLGEHEHRAEQPDALHSPAFQHQVCLQLVRHRDHLSHTFMHEEGPHAIFDTPRLRRS